MSTSTRGERRPRKWLLGLALALPTSLLGSSPTGPDGDRPATRPWGSKGHTIAAEAASLGLPREMPGFFLERWGQLAYLNPEPDRWRDRERREMDEAFSYDHYIDLERVPPGVLDQPDRWEFVRALYEAGIERPEADVGLLPYHIIELYQRLESAWRRWRATENPQEQRWIEDRIIQDAGVLGHYVTDASQPHHTTIHFNGWDAEAPNPEGFTLDRTFHSRFETAFVDAHVSRADLAPRLRDRTPRAITDVRAAVMEHIQDAHGEVVELYRLDRDVGFDPERADPRTVEFTLERLAAGAMMLQDLWWSAWVASGA